MTQVLEKLRKLRLDTESQISELESKKFKLVHISADGQAESDCTLEQVAILRSRLRELTTIIELVSRELPRPPLRESKLEPGKEP